MVQCPFCGAGESDRFDLDARRFIVFACSFSPEIDPSLSEAALDEHLRSAYGTQGSAYFRQMCDRLHLFVRARPELGADPREAARGSGESGAGAATPRSD